MSDDEKCRHNRVFDHGEGTYTCWNCGVTGRWMPRRRRIKWSDEKRKRKPSPDAPKGGET